MRTQGKRYICAFLLFVVSCCAGLLCTSLAWAETVITGDIWWNLTWQKGGSPYIFTGVTNIRDGKTLTIDTSKGPIEILFRNSDAKLIVGRGSEGGTLKASGTAQNKIYFKPENAGGTYKGIEFDPGATGSNELKHCIIENGGDNHNGMVYVRSDASILIQNCTISQSRSDGIYINPSNENASPTIDNCTIENNNGDGIFVEDNNRYCYSAIKNNRIRNNEGYGVQCQAGQDHYFSQVSNNTFEKNDNGPLRIPAYTQLSDDNVFADNSTIELYCAYINNSNVTWHNFGVPYIIKNDSSIGNIELRADRNSSSTLTIMPGTTCLFSQGVGLKLYGSYSEYRWLKIIATGTEEEPITFSTSTAGQYWGGIGFQWLENFADTRLQHCIIEYGGNGFNGNISFSEPNTVTNLETIKNSTIRYSASNGIYFTSSGGLENVHNCNIYGNAQIDIANNNPPDRQVEAQLNYWGTPNGPTQGLCSSAIVSEGVNYEAWLAEPFTEPFRFSSASASPVTFNPVAEETAISFSLTATPEQLTGTVNWKISVLDRRYEKIWSTSGTGTNGSVTWDGMGEYGAASGTCFYKIEATSSLGTAAPAMGLLEVGDGTVARITEPAAGQLYSPGAQIDIVGIASLTGGTYYLTYGEGSNPTVWLPLDNGPANDDNSRTLHTWDTTTMDQPEYTVKLDVTSGSTTYSDVVRVNFLVQDAVPDDSITVRVTEYTYDKLGRLTGVAMPKNGAATGDSVSYSYDKVGNRLLEQREVPSLIELVSFSAHPTLKGVVIEWETGSETDSAGFNLYRKPWREKEFEKITSSLIPARGSATAGAEYVFTDVPDKVGLVWQYILEEVETDGTTTKYGPVSSINLAVGNLLDRKQVFRKARGVQCD